jgi:DNA-directed RNA polymerase subunit M/transcription elongation factor TFIIS
MNESFCSNCDNFMFTYSDKENNLYNCCKQCGNKELVENKVYNFKKNLNNSDILNRYKYIFNDNTLPIIKNNKNIKCTNDKCNSNINKIDNSICYIKYDITNMNYIYSCNICGQKWTNKE